jgi:hypothetical protein
MAFMLAAFIGQRVLWLLFGQKGLGHFFRHPPLLPIGIRILQLVCQSKQCQPLLVRHLQQDKQVLSLFNHTSNAIFHGKKKTIL